MTTQDRVDLFKYEVWEKSILIDPEERQDWESLALGWALGKGLTVFAATEFAYEVTCNPQKWNMV